MARVLDREVVDESCSIVCQLQVGVDVEMSAQANGQRVGRDTHLIEVKLLEICAQRTIETGRRQQGIEVDSTLQQGVATDEVGMCLTVTDQCMGCDIVDIQFAIAHMVYRCSCNKCGTW